MQYTFKEYTESALLKNHLNMGGESPSGEKIEVTSRCLLRDGKPRIEVMGEYHFVRDKSENWYRELEKMRAGGVTVVATYIFWIYHEEIEGEFDFTGDRDLRKFILDARRAGLDVLIRIGPWAHGECRNGGFPDWLMKKPYALRDNNPEYMEKVRIWYEKIFEQVKGLFFEDGGNIIGIQFENELTENAPHLLALKKLALSIGYKAPLYTVTGWSGSSAYGAKIPVDDVLPVFGGYPEAPWEESLEKLPPSPNYSFNKMRNDSAIGKDLMRGTDRDGYRLPYEKYPFATCELGGGIQVTHHRRPIIRGMDIYALSLVKLGSGNNLVGYYMYKGGTNKIGKRSTLNESKATGYPNDYAVLSYDFQAPISEYGEIREQYRLTNLLHLFVRDFGDVLAPMENVSSEKETAPDNFSDLRYTMRTDGRSGFVFVNHYQRLEKLADVFGAVLDTGKVTFPPIDVCGDVCFFFPFNLSLGKITLEYATAQPICRVKDAFFFTAIGNIPVEYKLCGEKYTPKENEILTVNGVKIVTLPFEKARYLRKLGDTVYVGENSDLYECGGKICAAEDGSFAYEKWNGSEFERIEVKKEFTPCRYSFEETDEPFLPPYAEELNIGGERKRTWKKISVTSADGKECFLVLSERKDDFYKEF